ncbi:MAG: peptidyl-prolyl cis-trans isomerase [Candidatus Omnitrophica bacterium]|nr:peptidyl-prolyl cis-trans isomerase [Candidatus Omnitrophota bacterium]
MFIVIHPFINRIIKSKFIFSVLIIMVCTSLVYLIFWVIQLNDPARFKGKVFDRRITTEKFDDVRKHLRLQARLQYGELFDSVEALIDWDDQTWEQIILFEQARQKGVRVRNKEVIEQIAKYPFFQRNGSFDFSYYKMIVRGVLYVDPKVFEESVREALIIKKLYDQVTQHITCSDEEILKEYRLEHEKAQLSYLLIPFTAAEKEVSVSDQEVRNYYENNKKELKVPLSINIEYIRMDYPEEGGIQKQVETKFKARAIYDQYAETPDLKTLAEKFKFSLKETGFFTKDKPNRDMGLQISEIWRTFNMKKNELQYPLETPQGWLILRVKDIRQSYTPDLEETYETILDTLKFQSLVEQTVQKARSITDDISRNGATPSIKAIQAIAKTSPSYTLKDSPFLPINQLIAYLGTAPSHTDILAGLNAQAILLPPIQTSEGICLALVIQYQPIDMDEYLKNKNSFLYEQLEQKKKAEFNQYSQELKEKANLQLIVH